MKLKEEYFCLGIIFFILSFTTNNYFLIIFGLVMILGSLSLKE